MKVTQVSIRPTEAAEAAARPALTPELLAATGARYSRNNEGLKSILKRIDPCHLDQSVDAIFRMIDYGHQSIADMAPVAMFIDGISMWLAYLVWTLCPTAGGQESSTRYLRMSLKDLIPSETLGIPEEYRAMWLARMEECVAAYHEALEIWKAAAVSDPSVARIPRSVLEDPSEKASKQVARMYRNYGFDRARYFLPAAAATNIMLVISARGWVQLCQYLLSYPLPEPQALGAAIRNELGLSAPRMLRHATEKPSIVNGIRQELNCLQNTARDTPCSPLIHRSSPADSKPVPSLDVFRPSDAAALADDLCFHDNRYAWIGQDLKRTLVRFRWDAVAFAEIRDLNRHRPGTKYCPLLPNGFYSAMDQVDAVLPPDKAARLVALAECGRAASAEARRRLAAGESEYIYWTLLGTQYPFEHNTTADKFIYEAELRTGTGAHFRYAQHLHDMLALWFDRFPETRGLILEGTAEPE